MTEQFDVEQVCKQVKKAAKALNLCSTEKKNQLLRAMADELHNAKDALIAANNKDVENGKASGLTDAMIDRLTITDETISQMQTALIEVAELDDPLAQEYPADTRPNGIVVTKKRIPLGVILMIYESRPNVTVEAAALAFKSGNGIILRGGKEAFESNQAIARCWRAALKSQAMDENMINVLNTTDREVMNKMLKLDELIDVVIPRGGEGLIRHVVANSYIPVIKHYKGVCHLYVDEFADLEKAKNILINGKTQRTGVCNALEGLVVHKKVAEDFLPSAIAALKEKGTKVYGCEQTRKLADGCEPASEAEYMAEFLALEISSKVVDDFDAAIEYIDQYGSGHTEVIITEDKAHAESFIRQADASVVMVNASSRFSDGSQLGLGAEIGISTSKIHAYGPMGLESLTSEKFVVRGEGQIRD